MAVGLYVSNGSNSTLFDEDSSMLTFVRKGTTTGVPTVAANEIVAYRSSNWIRRASSKDFFIFNFNPATAGTNVGLAIHHVDGSLAFRVGEGYARIAAHHTLNRSLDYYDGVSTDEIAYEGLPSGQYAIIFPRVRVRDSLIINNRFWRCCEDLRTTATGFRSRVEVIEAGYYAGRGGDLYFRQATAKVMQVVVVDVAGL